MNKILGIDPGIINIGLSCLNLPDNILTNLEHHVVSNLPEYLNVFKAYIKETKPDIAVFEQPDGNIKSKKYSILEIIGIQKLILEYNNIPYHSFMPPEIKRIYTGNGRANKTDIQKKTVELFGDIPEIKNNHIADSVAIAYTYYLKCLS